MSRKISKNRPILAKLDPKSSNLIYYNTKITLKSRKYGVFRDFHVIKYTFLLKIDNFKQISTYLIISPGNFPNDRQKTPFFLLKTNTEVDQLLYTFLYVYIDPMPLYEGKYLYFTCPFYMCNFDQLGVVLVYHLQCQHSNIYHIFLYGIKSSKRPTFGMWL